MALPPGQRMAATVARAVVLDNAEYFALTASRCDTDRPAQRKRQMVLEDLQAQQLWKADRLAEQLRADARAKKPDKDSCAVVSRPAGSVRFRADVGAGVPIW
eukprot:2788881-Pyramimonas_sp.AAC.1